MNIHFIAIGGAVMHNLAIALHKKGYKVTGSDDEIFEPSKSRLAKYGLLPETQGWDPKRLDTRPDAVILGMHAHEDNIELKRARELNLRIYSFPEFLYEQTKDKKRVVIAGSHGKTTITSMIMHVLNNRGMNFDYMVGSILEGFETMVKLDKDSKVAVFEGDEYLSSPLDRRPKFLHYKPDVALISGIAWDHMNVFPEYDQYLDQFAQLCRIISQDGILVYNETDAETKKIAENAPSGIKKIPYSTTVYSIENEQVILKHEGRSFKLNVFGKHNMENLSAAMTICEILGVGKADFLLAMTSFAGAAKRQEILASTDKKKVFIDFAHAPSKVKATVTAFRELFTDKKIFACLELHTFSSLNKAFLPGYSESLNAADTAVVFFDPQVVKHKRLDPLSVEFIKDCFKNPDLQVFDNRNDLETFLRKKKNEDIILFMSSGNFSGLNLKEIAKHIADQT